MVVFEVANPAIALLILEVFDEDVTSAEFVAYASLPLTCAAAGVRNCALFDKFGRSFGDFQYASLSVRLCVEYY